MRLATFSKFVTWVQRLTSQMLQPPTMRSRHTWSVVSIERPRSFSVCPMIMQSICGPLAVPCTSFTRGKSCSLATVTIKCSKPLWKSEANLAQSSTNADNSGKCISMISATSSVSNETKYWTRYVDTTLFSIAPSFRASLCVGLPFCCWCYPQAPADHHAVSIFMSWRRLEALR